MIIKNGKVFKENTGFVLEDLLIFEDKITDNVDLATSDSLTYDASGKYIIPGLVDIHSHGAVGHDFCDASVEGLKEILKYEKSIGVTSYCPTSMTLSKEMLLEIFNTAKDVSSCKDDELAQIVGVNMEGPFISDAKKGAQNGKYISKPDVGFFKECNKAAEDLIKLVTLAPEIDGSLEFIKELKDKVAISIGHSAANFKEADSAFKAGANHVTHLFNGMTAFSHREPGIFGAAADNKNVIVELICDGIHVHPATIRSAFKVFGAERIALISDSMEATGMPDGDYELGKQHVIKRGTLATLEDGTIAGSATNLFDAMKHAIEFGIPAEDAITSATVTPAKSIGMYPEIGSLSAGSRADILILDEAFNLEKII